MASIATQIEIAASPERVREVFLDFPKYPEWSHDFIKSIETADASKPPKELIAGDTLTVAVVGMTFSPTLLENSETQFKWRGSLPYIFTGEHYFRFEPSKTTPGSTTFMQGENFSGALSFLMMLPFGMGKTTGPGFEKFNEELKKRVEEGGK